MSFRPSRGVLAAVALLFAVAGESSLSAADEGGGFKLRPGTVVHFSSVAQGRKILG